MAWHVRGALLGVLILGISRLPAHPPAATVLAAPLPAGGGLEQPPSLQTIRMGLLPTSLGNAGLLIAQARGYFQQQGIELDVSNFDGGVQMVAPLGTGQLDAGAGGPGAVLYNAVERGVAIKVVGDNGSTPPGFGWQALLVRKPLVDSGAVRTIADLRGRKVALVSLASGAEITMARAIRNAGLQWDDVEFVTVPFPDMVPALANASIDAALVIEPLLSAAVASGSAVVLAGVDEIYPYQQLGLVMFASEWAARPPDLASGFMLAYIRGVRDYVDAVLRGRDREAVARTLAEARLLREAAQFDELRPVGLDPNGRVNVTGMKEDLDYFLARGIVRNRIDIDALVDHQYADRAVLQLGEYR
jgi:NitT/TauT family transport system substrate-binding protein